MFIESDYSIDVSIRGNDELRSPTHNFVSGLIMDIEQQRKSSDRDLLNREE